MTYEEFLDLCETVPGTAVSEPHDPLLLSLWHDRRGHWDVAHEIAQSIRTPRGSALHAYLHREEGDVSNAEYWYSRAGRKAPGVSIAEEWSMLAKEFLGDS